MNLQHRVELLEKLGNYILEDNEEWQQVCHRATLENAWFTPDFVQLAANTIARSFLTPEAFQTMISTYSLPSENKAPKQVGIIMAGNIPLVGFHDFLVTFLSGHRQTIKPSSKDQVLIRHLVTKLNQWDPSSGQWIGFSDLLKSKDAYIATGSNNSSRYFEQYFGRYPHIIRRNRTSVAILRGDETAEQLSSLADDVHLYFGLGCRNVTKLYVPRNYDFVPLLESFKKYSHLADHHKYKNNYDYQLAVLIINKLYYMTNGAIILREDASVFSPISQLNYEFYDDPEQLRASLVTNQHIQCIVGEQQVPFGRSQFPGVLDFADGVDTLQFLRDL